MAERYSPQHDAIDNRMRTPMDRFGHGGRMSTPSRCKRKIPLDRQFVLSNYPPITSSNVHEFHRLVLSQKARRVLRV